MIYNEKEYVVSRYSGYMVGSEPNDVGRDIMSFITNHPSDSTIETLMGLLLAKYDIDEETLKKDVRTFIEACIKRDILVNRELDEESERVTREIQAIQREVPELTVSDFGYVAKLGDEFTPGCQSCARGKWAVMFVGAPCNLGCFFCPYVGLFEQPRGTIVQNEGSELTVSFLGATFTSLRELQLQASLVKDDFDGIAWVGGEPMMPTLLPKLLPFIRYFHEAYSTYHQWLYTNGTFATRENMQALYDAGIRELRFNLAATNFSKEVIENMKEARKIFDYLCIEIPMLKDSYEGLMKNYASILETGLDQMNLAEFIVGYNHFEKPDVLAKEGKLYNYKGFITSPISSRKYTYEVIKKAAEEKWPVVINDCSNEYKYYKLSVQQNSTPNIFSGGGTDYWNNSFPLGKVESFNEKLRRLGSPPAKP